MKQPPEPRYLNLEYIFNKFFAFLQELGEKLLEFSAWLSTKSARFSSLVISAILLMGIIVVFYKIIRLRRRKITALADFLKKEEAPKVRLNRWDEIQRRSDSENPADWKMAIIEADALIDEIFQNIGYKGENLGERLKSVEPSDFDNLQNIWEAHKIRNRIVHEGDKFALKKEEAKDTLEKYKKALKELKYI
jgi:hypothetical protein